MQLKVKLVFGGISVSLVVIVIGVVLGYYSFMNEQGCPIGQFQCKNSSKCIHQQLSCDNKFDCPEEDDEKGCYDLGRLHSMVNTLYKNQNSSTETFNSSCDISNVPNGCNSSCSKKPTLVCENTFSLDRIPNVEGPIRRFYFLNNGLKILQEGSFVAYPQLVILSMKSNPINKVMRGAFRGLENLSYLFFEKTQLRNIEPGFFEGLISTEYLSLNGNELADFDLKQLENLTRLQDLYLLDNNLTLKESKFPPLLNLSYLHLANNSIEMVGLELFSELLYLSNLNLNDNKIEFIHPGAFGKLKYLIYLQLHNNRIKNLHHSVFGNQIYLQDLSLSDNPLVNFNQRLVSNLTRLTKLHLQNVTIPNISVEMFQHMTVLNETYFAKFRYCRYVPRVRKCLPNTDGISSNEQLLSNVSQRVCVWVIIFFSNVGNLLVIFYRIPLLKKNLEDQRKSEHFFLINLAIADFFMTIYLTIIAVHDMLYRGEYIRHSNSFLSSWVCMLAGIIGTVSSEVSIITLTAMTIERWSTIAEISNSPLVQLRVKSMMLRLIPGIWTVAVLIAVVPIFIWSQRNEFYGNNGVCFPLNTNRLASGWQYSAFIMSLNLLCVGVMITCYALIIARVRSNQIARAQEVGNRGPKKHNTIDAKKMGVRIFAIVMTDCACWIPIIVTVFIGITGGEISLSLNSWLVIFVLPINSALNPIIYTFTSRIFSQSLNKLTHQLTASSKFRKRRNLLPLELKDRKNQSDVTEEQHTKSPGKYDEDYTQNTKLSTISPVSDSHLES